MKIKRINYVKKNSLKHFLPLIHTEILLASVSQGKLLYFSSVVFFLTSAMSKTERETTLRSDVKKRWTIFTLWFTSCKSSQNLLLYECSGNAATVATSTGLAASSLTRVFNSVKETPQSSRVVSQPLSTHPLFLDEKIFAILRLSSANEHKSTSRTP